MDISVPIVGYVFVCIIFPHLVKSKPQFYMAFTVLLLILSLDVIINITGSFSTFFKVMRGVLWIVDFVLLVLATGGLSLHELGGELQGAFEVMRRGETTKTVIVPLKGEIPKTREQAAAERAARDAKPSPRPPEDRASIPLD